MFKFVKKTNYRARVGAGAAGATELLLQLRLRFLWWFRSGGVTGGVCDGGGGGVGGGDAGDVHGVAVLVGELNRFAELVGQLDRVAVLIAYICHQ